MRMRVRSAIKIVHLPSLLDLQHAPLLRLLGDHYRARPSSSVTILPLAVAGCTAEAVDANMDRQQHDRTTRSAPAPPHHSASSSSSVTRLPLAFADCTAEATDSIMDREPQARTKRSAPAPIPSTYSSKLGRPKAYSDHPRLFSSCRPPLSTPSQPRGAAPTPLEAMGLRSSPPSSTRSTRGSRLRRPATSALAFQAIQATQAMRSAGATHAALTTTTLQNFTNR
mmetsp:Transcript_16385/g.48013  ORF Transcript_16385/g.48013 Transcript_16385/m.48013 type:complete len:225 (+) Transcript_16385:5-679(+)